MSKINCPECGILISDNVKKCPGCRFPIEKFVNPEYITDGNNYDFRDNTFINFSPKLTYSEMKKKIQKSKIKLYGTIIFISVVVIVVAIIFWFGFGMKAKHNIYVPDVQDITIEKPMKLNGKYAVFLNSNETRPFISVIKNKEDDIYNYVYMSDGRGEINFDYIESQEESDRIGDLEVVGYFSGYSLSQGDIDSVNDKYYYYDYIDRTYTTCTVDYEIKLDEEISGILFYDVKCNNEYESDLNKSMVIIDGVGRGSCLFDGLPYEIRNIKSEFRPLYFIPATELNHNDYTISKSFITNLKEYYDYEDKYLSCNMYGEIALSDKNEGVLLYSYTLGSNGNIGKKNGMANINKGLCPILISDFIMTDENSDISEPTVNICAYVDLNDIPVQK